jgi:predicted ATPase/class 3 adenylate cyclase
MRRRGGPPEIHCGVSEPSLRPLRPRRRLARRIAGRTCSPAPPILFSNVPQELSRHLAAVMFTDMAGYTALMQRDEAAALRSRQRHRAALERCVPSRAGALLQYFGDGSLCIFNSSVQAVEAAIDIQRELDGDPALRIGVHTGDIAYDEQGAYGDAINIAARLEAVCTPGGVTISDKVFDDIRRHPQLRTVPSGTVRLKNVADAVPTYALAVDGLAIPSPAEERPEARDEGRGEAGLPAQVADRLAELTRMPARPSRSAGALPSRIALVGRETEVGRLRDLVDMTETGKGSTVFLRGPRGIGKTRLAQEVAEHARERDWTVVTGRAYPSERLLPYGPFSDALMPLLSGLSMRTLAQLTPGEGADVCALFPALGAAPGGGDEHHGLPGETQTRLYWQFASMLGRLASHRPMLLVLEDLDFADRSSLELLHFVARQIPHHPILLVAVYAGTDEGRRRALRRIEQGLISAGSSTVLELAPLVATDSTAFVREVLGTDVDDTGELVDVVHTWSRGNPFFMWGTLRGLVEGGALRRVDGRWTVENLAAIRLPHSVRDAVLAWMSQLSQEALALANSLAVLDRELSYEVIRHISDGTDSGVDLALEELVRHQVLTESEARWSLMYSFRHPLIREILREELPLRERRRRHAMIGEALESFYGERSDEHADELAYHFGQAHVEVAGPKAIRYLQLAGEGALARHANREAADYLQEALDRIEAAPPGQTLDRIESLVSKGQVVASLARARRRLGKYDTSVALWGRVLSSFRAANDTSGIAQTHREIGLAYMGAGRLEEAIESFGSAAEAAQEVEDTPLAVRSQLAQSLCYQAIGRIGPAERVARASLALATDRKDAGLLARAYSALLRLKIWTGEVEQVRSHAEQALRLARESGDRGVEFWSQWAMGAMEGLIGNTSEMERRVAAAHKLAEEIGSPFAYLETNELAVELAYARGDWTRGLEVGTKAIELARSTGQRTVLPRLLVWVSFIRIGRGEYEIADALTSEAWAVSGAADAQKHLDVVDLHSVVPAHIGRAAYHLAMGQWDDAIRVAEQGLAIADRSGYVVWAIHHVMPIIAEACIHARYLERANEVGRRMRREAEKVGHRLGLVWADVCDGILSWLEGDATAGAVSLRRGAEALETIPLAFEAARLRRQLAGRLEELGEFEAAIRELRGVREVCVRLGALDELTKTDEHLARLGVTHAE